MKIKLSVLIITKNAEETIEAGLRSVIGWVDEIVVVDDYSTDDTLKKVKKFKGLKVIQNRQENLGRQRRFGLERCRHDWVLVLDADEVVSDRLRSEIMFKLQDSNFKSKYDGYFIPFQTHLFGRQLKYGGENYQKMALFKKKKVKIEPLRVGENFELLSGRAGQLKNKIFHYSYRSIGQMLKKFTAYALLGAKDRIERGEKTSLKKIFLYPAHMFWARFIKDKGYKDGLFRLPLDLGFAYMEFLMYVRMIFVKS